MKKKSHLYNLTFSAMCAALSFVLLYGGSATGVLDMSGAVFCGVITTVLLRECSRRYASCAVAVTFVLTFILLHDKTVSVLYVTAGGIYPLLKPVLDRVMGKFLSWGLKVLTAALISGIYIASMFLFFPAETTLAFIPAGLILGTGCLILYDVFLTKFAMIYDLRLRHIFRRK